MSRDWRQLRIRLPDDLLKEIEEAAEASGSTIQREILMRIIRGSRPAGERAEAQAYGTISGELEVAEKMCAGLVGNVESLATLLDQMRRTAKARGAAEDISDMPDEDEAE